MLTCPICHTQLVRNNNTLECTQHHTFDSAKEGYVNLVTRKLSASVGDTKEMLKARRDFLDARLYQALSDTLNTLVVNALSRIQTGSPDGEIKLLDAGCGEGYYLGRLQSFLTGQESDRRIAYFGLDISKEAIRMAARRYKNIQFVVADLKERLVFADSTIHLLLNIFAPRNVEEFARVLVPDGIVIVVIPGANHLRQLRESLSLLDIQENKSQHVEEQFAPCFTHLATSSVNYTLRLTQQEIEQVVMMTPNYWHLSNEIRARLRNIEGLETEVECMYLVFQKQ